MATVTLGAPFQKEHAESRLILIAPRDILDAFVANRMRRTAAKLEHVRPPRLRVPPTPTDNSRG